MDEIQNSYVEVVNIINAAKERAYSRINEELILMYRQIGKYISEKSADARYGDAYVNGLAEFFANNYPELKGFTRRGLYRMKQFFELYKDDRKVSPLVTQLSWTNHLQIMSAKWACIWKRWTEWSKNLLKIPVSELYFAQRRTTRLSSLH